jgi:hypothetical protein
MDACGHLFQYLAQIPQILNFKTFKIAKFQKVVKNIEEFCFFFKNLLHIYYYVAKFG